MTRKEFVSRIERYFNSKKEAAQCADNYTDKELTESGEEILSDLQDDFRFSAQYNRLQTCGY